MNKNKYNNNQCNVIKKREKEKKMRQERGALDVCSSEWGAGVERPTRGP